MGKWDRGRERKKEGWKKRRGGETGKGDRQLRLAMVLESGRLWP